MPLTLPSGLSLDAAALKRIEQLLVLLELTPLLFGEISGSTGEMVWRRRDRADLRDLHRRIRIARSGLLRSHGHDSHRQRCPGLTDLNVVMCWRSKQSALDTLIVDPRPVRAAQVFEH